MTRVDRIWALNRSGLGLRLETGVGLGLRLETDGRRELWLEKGVGLGLELGA